MRCIASTPLDSNSLVDLRWSGQRLHRPSVDITNLARWKSFSSFENNRCFRCCSATNKQVVELEEWDVLSNMSLSEALAIWRSRYELEHEVEVLNPRHIKQTSKTLCAVFSSSSSLPFLDGFQNYLFQADIISGLQSNIHNRTEDDYAVLLVWDKKARDTVLGTVQVSRQNETAVLKLLPEENQSYAYISSMAVLNSSRRSGIGSALLSAAEFVAWLWGENEIVLHVHYENQAACALYQNQGYTEIYRDEQWKSVIRPCTLLLRKQSA